MCLQYKSFENNACYKQFLFPQYFLLFWRTFRHFHQFQNCRLQPLSVWKSLKFVIWERVKIMESFVAGENFCSKQYFLPFSTMFSKRSLPLGPLNMEFFAKGLISCNNFRIYGDRFADISSSGRHADRVCH